MQAQKPRLPLPEIRAWLDGYHGETVVDLTPLPGGFWSAAYAYRVGDEELVLRLNDGDEGFRIDEEAMRFAGPKLPVPTILERGAALDRFFAISRRHAGRFIETAPASEAPAIGSAMASLLAALRAVPARGAEGVEWYDAGGEGAASWHAWLLGGITDEEPGGWRERLASRSRVEAVFRACESRIQELLPLCPERRDLVHGDLLHQNVLVDDGDPSCVTAVFSWKCSARGDFLYDVAWCTVWSPWHPAIAGGDLWQRTLDAPDLSADDLARAPERHHCYELQIAASHLGWYARIDDPEEQDRLAEATEGILARGPRV